MKSSFTHLFYIKKSKADVNQKANIYLRITVNGKRSELSIDRKVPIDKWNSIANKVKGFSKEAQEINQYIELITNKLNKIHQKFVDLGKPFTSLNIRDKYLGKDQNQKMLLKIFQDHNNQVEKLVGKEFAEGTALRYRTAKSHIEEFIKFEYKVNDIAVTEVDHKFITGFEYYLKTERNCAHNTAIKYITNFKKVIRIVYANGWITKDPFFNWKARLKTVDRQFLSELEIEDLINKQFGIPRLEQVRDLFVFSCFTGLAYADVRKLKKENIVIGIDGNKWINTKRKKTDTISNIPLLPTSLALIEKYATHKNIVNSDKLLPVLSNQKMNAYLKEIADLCGITKNLTFHLARHTFATTITLTNGVPIESVSKMLGHKSLKTTQHYAKIIDRKVSDDMNVLKEKLNIGKKNTSDSSEKSKKSI
ncbi:site-specific integrase [Lutibacter maritimus]|jgi:site-specific recombinase XerD|uniref:Site-specific recombinase XerD n=1 Tax=Lutibacter maritimus TaxID=593133 RepID=A0A1I6Q0W0_9FLAO|nr:site-specific integrase [Lutibacter maritimus]SFS46063.1 Site-specific recombinase XerD [Lutibacter maritimus]